MARVIARKCTDCEHKYDLFEHKGVLSLFIDEEPDRLRCPACGATGFVSLVTVATGIELGGGASTGKLYPHYNRGLGCMVESKEHLRRLCKERGLVPIEDSGWDPTDKAAEREFHESADAGDREFARVETDREFGRYRELRARAQGRK